MFPLRFNLVMLEVLFYVTGWIFLDFESGGY